MDRQALRRTSSGTGLLFERRESAPLLYRGSCFSIVEPTVFVTASHCVPDVPLDRLCINHFGGPSPDLLSSVHRVERVEKLDVAVLKTEAPDAKWAVPFKRVRYAADMGEDICAFGYPQSLMSVAASIAMPRFFRGNIQRPFIYERANYRYSAYELSFACPPGLSGGPVFLAEDMTTVIGVVTENFKTYTTIDEEIEERNGEEFTVREVRQVISYGVATNIFNAAELIESVLGYQLPDPEPEVSH